MYDELGVQGGRNKERKEERGEKKESKRNETRNRKRDKEREGASGELEYGEWIEEGECWEVALVVAAIGEW